MAFKKLSSKHYNNFGGINEKSTPTSTPKQFVLKLVNMDFDEINGFKKRPGSTAIGVSGLDATGASSRVVHLDEFKGQAIMQHMGGNGSNDLFISYRGASGTGATWTEIASIGDRSGAKQKSRSIIGDEYIFTDRQEYFYKWNGSTLRYMGLTPDFISRFAVGFTAVGTSGPFNAVRYAVAPINDRGFIGPLSPPVTGYTAAAASHMKIFFTRMGELSNYGHTAWALLRSDYQWSAPYTPGPKVGAFYQIATLAIGESMYTDQYGNTSFARNTKAYTEYLDWSPGGTQIPKRIGSYKDQLVVDDGNSNIYLSVDPDIEPDFERMSIPEAGGIPVKFDDDNEVDFTCFFEFQDTLLIFKQSKFYRWTGRDQATGQLEQVSNQVGCISETAILEIDDGICLWLERKGIVRYDGASWKFIHYPVETTIRRMNVAQAEEQACAGHWKERNQVWFSFPVDSDTDNTMTVVYDYAIDAWSTFEGIAPSALADMKLEFGRYQMFMGTPSLTVSQFSPTYYADNGQGFTCLVRPAWNSPMGENIEHMFRRLFLNVNTVSGATGAVNISIYKDYDFTTIQATNTVYQNQHQTRIDFGVMGQAASFELSHFHASLPFSLYGYTWAHRYLRNR